MYWPGAAVLGKRITDELKEVHYDKKGNLVVPTGLTYGVIREQLRSAFSTLSSRIVYSVFESEVRRYKDETDGNHFQEVLKKYQRMKDLYRVAIAEEIMYHLKFERIAINNPFSSEEGIESISQIIGNAAKRNIYILLNHKYRKEIKSQNESGKRRRPVGPKRDEITVAKFPRRTWYQNLCDTDRNGSFGIDYGDDIQEQFFTEDSIRFQRLNADRLHKSNRYKR